MATGTGKTRTALTIVEELEARALADTVVIAAYGTDLLDQWHRELVRRLPRAAVFRAYGAHREAQSFLDDPIQSVLLTSRQSLAELLPRLRPTAYPKAILVCDEVHGMGSPALVGSLAGKLGPFAFRLGLSATPEREYGEEGNAFITREIGPVIFRFGLKEAIERGILCPFDYVELDYAFSDDDRAAARQAIRRFHAKARSGAPASPETMYQEIARVRQLSKEKIAPFAAYASGNPRKLDRCKVFVETAEYGMLVQEVLMSLRSDWPNKSGISSPTSRRTRVSSETAGLSTMNGN